jgi:hypothetical protein
MIRMGDLIVPLINLMDEVQLGYDIVQMDETSVQVLKGKRASSPTFRRTLGRGVMRGHER